MLSESRMSARFLAHTCKRAAEHAASFSFLPPSIAQQCLCFLAAPLCTLSPLKTHDTAGSPSVRIFERQIQCTAYWTASLSPPLVVSPHSIAIARRLGGQQAMYAWPAKGGRGHLSQIQFQQKRVVIRL